MKTRRITGPPRGAAIVELAICIPVLVLLIWGTTELNNAIFLKQTLTSAAHEGALFGLRTNSTEQEVLERIDLVLSTRTVGTYTTEIESSTGKSFSELLPGDPFTIVIESTPIRDLMVVSFTAVEARVTAVRQ